MTATSDQRNLKADRTAKSTWNLHMSGKSYVVELRHSKWGMPTSVLVDDEIVYKSGDLATVTYSADIPLQIGMHDLLISIRDTMLGSNYSISVDSVVLDGPDPSLVSVKDDRNRIKSGGLRHRQRCFARRAG